MDVLFVFVYATVCGICGGVGGAALYLWFEGVHQRAKHFAPTEESEDESTRV